MSSEAPTKFVDVLPSMFKLGSLLFMGDLNLYIYNMSYVYIYMVNGVYKATYIYNWEASSCMSLLYQNGKASGVPYDQALPSFEEITSAQSRNW